MDSPAAIQVPAERIKQSAPFFQATVPDRELEIINHSAFKEVQLATAQQNRAACRAERAQAAVSSTFWDSIFDPFEDCAPSNQLASNHTPEGLEDDLDRTSPPGYYGRPSLAARRPQWEPPVFDYRRYEEDGDMYYLSPSLS